MSISEAIRLQRRRTGISQTELARRMEVSQQTLSRWEHGGTPRKASLDALAAALDLSPAVLLELAGYSQPSAIPDIHTVLLSLGDWAEHDLWLLAERTLQELMRRRNGTPTPS